jgi:hypothetical protein
LGLEHFSVKIEFRVISVKNTIFFALEVSKFRGVSPKLTEGWHEFFNIANGEPFTPLDDPQNIIEIRRPSSFNFFNSLHEP